MKPANPRILTINGGSSSIKFALFEAGDPLRRIPEGGIERTGVPKTGPPGRNGCGTRQGHPRPPRQWREPGGGA